MSTQSYDMFTNNLIKLRDWLMVVLKFTVPHNIGEKIMCASDEVRGPTK